MTRKQQASLIGLLQGWLEGKRRECMDSRVQDAIKDGKAQHWIQLLDNTKKIDWRNPQACTFTMKDGRRYALRFEEL